MDASCLGCGAGEPESVRKCVATDYLDALDPEVFGSVIGQIFCYSRLPPSKRNGYLPRELVLTGLVQSTIFRLPLDGTPWIAPAVRQQTSFCLTGWAPRRGSRHYARHE